MAVAWFKTFMSCLRVEIDSFYPRSERMTFLSFSMETMDLIFSQSREKGEREEYSSGSLKSYHYNKFSELEDDLD